MTAYVALGKIGDIINILPILSDEYRKTKERQILIVAKAYAELVQHLNYIKLVEYDGSWEDIQGAIVFAKQRYEKVVVLSLHGNDFKCQHKTPSFLMEPWERAGRLADFDSLPLVIDGRNFDRELALFEKHTGKGPFILYADHGESSPFYSKEKLADLIHEVIGRKYQVVRLSEVRAEHFFDLLMLYERAALIVSTETAHLHLTRAVKTPVIAFTHDMRSRWHGSPQCRRFRLTCRYSDFDRRRHEIVRALQDPEGVTSVMRVTLLTRAQFGYNPTVTENFPGMIFRHHPDRRSWKTKLVYQSGGQEIPVTVPEQFDGMSLEDPRLFWFKNQIHVSFVAARHEFGRTNAVTAYGRLVVSGLDSVRIEDVHVPEFGLNNWGGVEKNWLFFDHCGRLACIYDCDGEQIVLHIEKNRVREIMRTPAMEWAWGKIRGGAILPWKGRLLRFFHSHTVQGNRENWIYTIGAVTMEDKPPFRMLQISKAPIISGDESLNLYCRHWKPNVVFPGGVQLSPDGSMELAYGYNDCECRKAFIHEKDLNL